MLRYLTAGESHGPALTVILEGMPSGVPINSKFVSEELARRRLGYGRGPRMKIEKDALELLSGVRFGKSLASPISLVIRNSEWSKWERVMSPEGAPAGNVLTKPRPGHADLVGMLKYDLDDSRNVLERSSARETAARVGAGALAKQFLAQLDITVISHVVVIGSAQASEEARPGPGDLEAIDASQVRCFDPEGEKRMVEEIEAATQERDSLGGIFEVIAYGLPVGLGSYVHGDRRLDARLAQAVMSIQAIKGVEVGDGFANARKRGSESHDEIFYDAGRFTRRTDRAGGTEGGVSMGGALRVRAAMKPLSTLRQPLRTVDVKTKDSVTAFKERTDVCSVPAAGVVGESMVALVLANEVLEKFGGDNLGDIRKAMEAYQARIDGR
ncbi:MAG: chorismate synthase [Actinobacteria bacterium]|nr:chorismate synthase [Actinomycetota bacterium]